MFRRSIVAPLSLLALACATPPAAPPIQAPVLVPGAGETVSIDQLVVLIDASSSVTKSTLFRDQKTLIESFARSMPNGRYETGSIAFGGFERTSAPLAAFDRRRVVAETSSIEHLDEGTPIHRAIAEAGAALEGKSGQAAIVLYSDGLLTDEVGREVDPQLALAAVAAIQESYAGTVCLHTVQTGSDPAGTAFLRQLAASTDCGSFRQGDGVTSVAALQQFERDVFLGAALPAVAAAPGDLDGDGVIDANDLCPGTPRAAAVDERGCWVAKGLLFAHDSSTIDTAGAKGLDEVAQVLRADDGLRVEIDGHTDAVGEDAYNQSLSERRAQAARNYLISAGISASRLEAKGLGEARPAADNATPDGRRSNRRTEITVLR